MADVLTLSRPAVDAASDQMYRSIFENAIEGIFQTTPAGQYLNVNPALAKMYGYDSTEDLIQGLTRIDHQLYVDGHRRGEFVRMMREQKFVRGFESQIYRKDKSIMWISENARSVLNDAGELLYFEGMVEDITERKRLEKRLLESEGKLSALINNIEDAIWSIDTELRLISFNVTFSNMFTEYFGKMPQPGGSVVDVLPSPLREEHRENYKRALAGERFVEVQRYEMPQGQCSSNIPTTPSAITGTSPASRCSPRTSPRASAPLSNCRRPRSWRRRQTRSRRTG